MRVTMYISDRLGHEAKESAHDDGLSLSALTAKALEQYLKGKRKSANDYSPRELIRPGSVASDAWHELERGRADDRA